MSNLCVFTYAEITFPGRLYHLGALVCDGVFFLLAFRVHIFIATWHFMVHSRYFYHFSRTHSPPDIIRHIDPAAGSGECTLVRVYIYQTSVKVNVKFASTWFL